MNGIFMIYNDESEHGSDPNVNKIPKRKMVIFLEILHNHRDKFKIQKEN